MDQTNKSSQELVIFETGEKLRKEHIFQNASEAYSDADFVRGLVQLIPYAGGSLDTWMGASARKAEKERLEQFLKQTAVDFGRLDATKLNYDFLKSEEFYLLFKRISVQAMQADEAEKIKLLSSAFANFAAGDTESLIRNSYLEVLSHLNSAHVVVLRTLVENEPPAHYVTKDNFGNETGGFMHAPVIWMRLHLPQIAHLNLELICADLARYDLLEWEKVGSFATEDDTIRGGGRGYRPSASGRQLVKFLAGTDSHPT